MILCIVQILKKSLCCFFKQVLCHLTNLRILDIAGNVIQIFPTGVSRVEFYYNGKTFLFMLLRLEQNEQPVEPVVIGTLSYTNDSNTFFCSRISKPIVVLLSFCPSFVFCDS